MVPFPLATAYRIRTGPEMNIRLRISPLSSQRETGSSGSRTDRDVSTDGIDHLRVRWEDEGESRAVWAIGEVDLASVEELRNALDCSQRRLRIDLSGVTFMDLTGLGCLIDVAERHESVTLVVSPRVERLLDLTGAGHLFHTNKNSEA